MVGADTWRFGHAVRSQSSVVDVATLRRHLAPGDDDEADQADARQGGSPGYSSEPQDGAAHEQERKRNPPEARRPPRGLSAHGWASRIIETLCAHLMLGMLAGDCSEVARPTLRH